jgi:K+-sensing histidine kinase KdpD
MHPVLLPDRASRLRYILSAVAGPAVITSATLLLPHVAVATAALAYVPAVAAASLLGGLPAGVGAALLSFAALHFFFTPPPGFGMPVTADLVALVTFLIVSIVVGAMVWTTVAQRIRAERSAREASLMHQEAATSKATAALFSSVTHDLRTPLVSILASATSLRDLGSSLDAEDRAVLLDAICKETGRLNRLVGRILDLSRMRAGALRPERVPAAIEDVVLGVVTRLEPLLDGHDVVLDIPPGLPDVALDVLQIDEVVTNLVENAANYSPPGTSIAITAGSIDGSVRVEVRDRGSGIDEADRERVFEPFETAPGTPSRGAGLGLAICRALIEAHGGRIWVGEAIEPGTSVVFELPVEASR